MAQTERIALRVDEDIKLLAERAAAALGCASLTEYITNLIRENAPEAIEQKNVIELTNKQFDHFIAVCNGTERKPSAQIIEAAKRLDKEGF